MTTTHRIEIKHALRRVNGARRGHGMYYVRFNGDLIGTWRVPISDAARWLCGERPRRPRRPDRDVPRRRQGRSQRLGRMVRRPHGAGERDRVDPLGEMEPYPDRSPDEEDTAAENAVSREPCRHRLASTRWPGHET
ncbi:MAG TPA: hypothetical protein VFE60_24000 [Roseiarcus sp.]|jgi:hypothetical protein|nr:hypothetical protein [Roseiarcus sp.]